MLGQAELPGPATGIKASNGYVYVGVGGSGLQVIDASDPSNPRLAECFTTRSTSLVKDVDVAGDYVYFVDHMSSGLNGSGLNILDVTDPSRPLLAGRATMPSGGAAVVVYGSYAFIAGATDDSGFRIFPAQCGGTTPVLTAEVEARATSGAIELRWDSPSSDFVEFGVDRAASREPAESDYRRIATVPAEEHPRGAVYRFVDADVSPHHWYCYRIIGRSSAGDERVLGEASSSATAVLEPTLFAPWPSYSQGPFRLRFALPLGADVQVDVCDASGRRVRALCRDVMIPGGHELIWDGRDGSGRPVPSGTYSLRLADGPREVTQRVIVIR
jgi:hypothetical protein